MSSTSADDDQAVARVRAYHERTKHHPNRYARSAGYMDWDTQPDPFRVYTGAPRVELPLVADELATAFGALHRPGAVAPHALDARSLGAFFELALGITAWKAFEGARWALRADPSSGNLHPTEGYAVLPARADAPAGLSHYVSRDHVLEQRCALDATSAAELARRLPDGAFLVGVASIHWREAWKYGERAFRYCQHDCGHVLATLRYAAAALGWSARLADELATAQVGALLGLDRDADFAGIDPLDREHPDVVLAVGPPEAIERIDAAAVSDVIALLRAGAWAGRPNVLSSGHVRWDVIDAAADASAKPARAPAPPAPADDLPPRDASCTERAATIIRERRSAVSLDGRTSISRAAFYAMLDAVLPRAGVPPFDVLPWAPRVHLGIFVHRVDELEPGLYVLERSAAVHAPLAELLGPEARWSRPPGSPEHLRLFLIGAGDCRRAAARVSCGQDIAADGAFSLGMLAEYAGPLAGGGHVYPRLFWETGVLGQALYLEAEAHGVRGTGIGCFFDDAVHAVMGLDGALLQSLYHFTIGGPIEDLRLTTLPAYDRSR